MWMGWMRHKGVLLRYFPIWGFWARFRAFGCAVATRLPPASSSSPASVARKDRHSTRWCVAPGMVEAVVHTRIASRHSLGAASVTELPHGDFRRTYHPHIGLC